MQWAIALVKGHKIAVYCSDVSGAFDRVDLERMTEKLKAKKLHPKISSVMVSWQRKRKAKVIVGGESSEEFTLENMVFQGIVFGPDLWNLFYEDARRAIQETLKAYKCMPATLSNDKILENLKSCQEELHSWGKANQVVFDAGKESMHILASPGQRYGKIFQDARSNI